MRLGFRGYLIFLCTIGLIGHSWAQETWDESDTAIANHYIQGLQREPVYGKVLGLLWDHYDKHDQTRLLLEYFDQAAKPDDALTAKLIYGHLLRRKGNSEQAVEQYRYVLDRQPDNIFVLTALAEVMDQEKRYEEAETYLAALAEKLDPKSQEWVDRQLSRAAIARKRDLPDQAVEIWLEVLKQRPTDLELRQRLVALLLEEGRTREAIASYEVLASDDNDVEMRMRALREMGRLYEFVDDFENASKTYERALRLVHYKHYLYDELIGRIVNLHERFAKIDSLEEDWLKAAEKKTQDEQSLLRMVKFYALTANLEEEEVWLKRLVELVPDSTQYRQELAELLIANDKFEEAADELEILIQASNSAPLPIVKMQARVALTLEGVPAAEKLLMEFMDRNSLSPEGLTQLLAFSQEHFLDTVVERLLRDQLERGWGAEGESPELRLATFHHERGRMHRVKELLRTYIEGAPTTTAKGKRLLHVAHTYREMNRLEEAREICQEAIDMGQGTREIYQVLGETYVEAFEVSDAVEHFTKAWDLSETIAERVEIDQRIFNVLRAKTGDRHNQGGWQGPRPTISGPSALLPGNDGWLSPDEAGRVTDLYRFYEKVRKAVETDPSQKNRFRAAWWAVEIQDFDEAYRHLPALHNPENPILEYEELLLKIAEQDERQGLILRQLELISKIEPDREEEYLIRKAQARLALGFEDEAIRTLKALVESPDASLRSVQALAKAYEGQERFEALRELWSRVYSKANILEKRQIIKPYANTLIKLDLKEEAIAIYTDLIETETDIIQRRKLFEDQMTFAARHYFLDSWMPGRYEELAQLYPLDAFYPEALSQVYLSTGRLDEAFDAMKRAYYMSDGDTELLERLGELASQTSNLKSAIYYQRKLLSGDQNISPDGWIALIERLERDMRIREADLTRARLESKFAQDPDFLRQLARHYLESGQISSARRILDKITALRPWDSASLLELGLLSLEEGDRQQAAASFERVLEQTSESAPLPGAPLEKAPFVPAQRIRTPQGQSAKLGVDKYAEYIEDFPGLSNDRGDRLANWMREAKPEFQRIPSEVEDQRLRAIEELARLNAGDDNWIQRWDKPKEVSPQERLWALYHGGFLTDAQQVLDEHLETKTRRDNDEGRKLLYTLMTLRCNQVESLRSWTEADPTRNNYVLIGVYVLLKDREHHFDDLFLHDVFATLTLSRNQSRDLLETLRIDDRLPAALQLGEAIANTQAIKDHVFLITLAGYAEALGEENRRLYWAEEALDNLQIDNRLASYHYYFYKTIQDNYLLQPNASGQREVIAKVTSKIDSLSPWMEREKDEAHMWLALATNQTELAVDHLRKLVRSASASDRSNLNFGTRDQDREVAAQRWLRLQGLLSVLGKWAQTREHLTLITDAVMQSGYSLPNDEQVLTEYQEFRLVQLLWTLETQSPPQREYLIGEYLAQIRTPDEHLELARSLESWHLVREAVPVYRLLVDMESHDYSNVRAYFSACRQAQAYEEALGLINDFFYQRRPFPESMTLNDLHKDRANFLMLSGNKDELIAMAEAQETRENRLHYQKDLVTLYLQDDDVEGAINVYEIMQGEDSGLRRGELMMLADLYIEAGMWEKARELVEAQPYSGNQVPDLQIIERLTKIYSSEELRDGAKLADLARTTLEYRGSSELVRELAINLAQTDRPGIADGVLSLKARFLQDPHARFEVLLEQANLRFTTEAIPLPDAESLVTLFHAWPRTERSGMELMGLLDMTAAEHGELWMEASEKARQSTTAKLLAHMTELFVNRDSATAQRIYKEVAGFGLDLEFQELRFASHAFQAAGHPKEALRLLDQLHARHEQHPRHDTDLAVQILTDLGRRDLILKWHQWNLDLPEPPTQMVEVANIFLAAGYPDLAESLYEDKYKALKVFNSNQRYFLTSYAEFLMNEEKYYQAQMVMKNLFHKSIGGDPKLLVDLYGKWGRLDRIESEVRKFYLSPAELEAVLQSAQEYPDHRPEPEATPEEPEKPDFRSRFLLKPGTIAAR